MIVTVACSVLFSAVFFVAAERPFLDLRERFVGRRSIAGAPVAASIELPAAPVGDVEVVRAVATDRGDAATEVVETLERHPVRDSESSPQT